MRQAKLLWMQQGRLCRVFFSVVLVAWALSCSKSNLHLLPNPDLSHVESQVRERIQQLQVEVEKAPTTSEAWGNLGMSLHVHGLKSQAVVCYKEAFRLQPTEFRWAYYCATALSDLASDEAFEWFEKSLALKPNYVPLNIIYGRVLFDSGEGEKSSAAFERVLEVEPDNAHASVGLAKIALARSELSKCSEHLRRAVVSDPKQGEAHQILAELYRRQGDADAATQALQIAEELPNRTPLTDPLAEELFYDGGQPTWFRDRGLTYQAQGRLEEAVREFEKAMQLRPDPEGYNHIGTVLRSQGKNPEAAQQFQTAANMKPRYYEAMNNLSATLFDLGQIQSAIDWGERSMRVSPNMPQAYLNLGLFYFHKNEIRRAIQVLRNGVKRTRSYPPVALRLAWLLATAPDSNLRNGKEALELAKFVCEEVNVKTAESLDVLAAAYAESGHFTEAQEAARKAVALADKNQTPEKVEQIKHRLILFQRHKPYREEVNASPKGEL